MVGATVKAWLWETWPAAPPPAIVPGVGVSIRKRKPRLLQPDVIELLIQYLELKLGD